MLSHISSVCLCWRHVASALVNGEWIERAALLAWTLDREAAPPLVVQKRLLVGNVEVQSPNKRAPNLDLPYGQTRWASRLAPTVVHSDTEGVTTRCDGDAQEHFPDEHAFCRATDWQCRRCTLVNEKKRRKCKVCFGVDPARPIKRTREI